MGLPARLGRLRWEDWGIHSKLEGHHFPGRSTAAWTDPKDIPARNGESGRVLEVRTSSEKKVYCWAVVAQAFNTSTQEAEVGGSL